MSTLTKKQRIILWLVHQGKTLRQRADRVFFSDKEHIGINSMTINKLVGLDLLDEIGGVEDGELRLSEHGKDFVKNRMRPFIGLVTYGGTWAAKPFRGCDYCGRITGRKSIKKFDCVNCAEVHRACPPCRNKHIRVKGEFPRYQPKLNACPPPRQTSEAPPPQPSVPTEPQKA